MEFAGRVGGVVLQEGEEEGNGKGKITGGPTAARKKGSPLRSLKNKPSSNASSTRQDIEDGNEPSIEGNIKVSLSRKGFVYNSTLKRYEKKLPNEKMMVFDVKTKKTSIL